MRGRRGRGGSRDGARDRDCDGDGRAGDRGAHFPRRERGGADVVAAGGHDRAGAPARGAARGARER